MKRKAKIYKGKRIVLGNKNLVANSEIHVSDVCKDLGGCNGNMEDINSSHVQYYLLKPGYNYALADIEAFIPAAISWKTLYTDDLSITNNVNRFIVAIQVFNATITPIYTALPDSNILTLIEDYKDYLIEIDENTFFNYLDINNLIYLRKGGVRLSNGVLIINYDLKSRLERKKGCITFCTCENAPDDWYYFYDIDFSTGTLKYLMNGNSYETPLKDIMYE